MILKAKIYNRGIKTKPHLLLHIFHDTSLGDPAWKPLPLRGRGIQAGRLVSIMENMQQPCGFAL